MLKDAEAEADRVERGDVRRRPAAVERSSSPASRCRPTTRPAAADRSRAVLAELGKDHGKAEDLVDDAKATVDEIKAFITEKDILRLPDPDRCQIIEMPEFQRGYSRRLPEPGPAAGPEGGQLLRHQPAAARLGRPPRRERSCEEYNRHMLQILTIHEAYPGHYVQLEYSNRHPSLVRKVL